MNTSAASNRDLDTVPAPVDVVIVGAGVTGLIAATRLSAEGYRVRVLEARDRVGGRLWTDEIDGQMYELGGQWVSPDQDALLETLAELELETYPRYREGESVYVDREGRARRFTGDIFPAGAETEAEIERLVEMIDELSAQVDPDSPWTHPSAHEWDHVSFDAWLARQSDDAEARTNVALFVAAAMLTKPAHAFSLLQALLMAASAGGFSHLVDADFILDRRVVGGLQRVPLELAARLAAGTVRLGSPVRRIEWEAERAVIRTDSEAYEARRVILAVPPTLYDRVDFSPPLPRLRQQLHQHQSFGFVIKVHLTYDTPFWRAEGLSGTAFSPFQLVHEAYDNTNHGETQGTLVAFVSDEQADRLFGLTTQQRRAEIVDSLASYFGDRAREPRVYYESDWGAEEWTRGAYGTSYDLGGLTRYGAMHNEPVGPILFGSSDLAGHGFQHVDGAIRVGRRLADTISRDIRPSA